MDNAVNDIVFNFMNDDVYDAEKETEKKTYAAEKTQFRRFIESKRESEDDKNKNTDKTDEKNNRSVETRVRYISVDSRDRDLLVYETPSQYTIDISKENFTNVQKVELVSTEFQNIVELIRATPLSLKNNLLYWEFEDDLDAIEEDQYHVYSTEFTTGNYDAESLQIELQTKMNSVPRIDGSSPNFEVVVDIVSDIVSITSISSTPISHALSVTALNSSEIQVHLSSHGFNQGREILISQSTDIGGIGSEYINQFHIVTSVTDDDHFTIQVGAPSTSIELDGGGEAIVIGQANNFRLVLNTRYSIGEVLGFPLEITEFSYIHSNSKEVFVYNNNERLKINKITQHPSDSQSCVVYTTLPHQLSQFDRIFIYDITPEFTNIETFDGSYNTQPLDDSNLNEREDFVSNITAASGHLVDPISEMSFRIAVPFVDYRINHPDMTITSYIQNNIDDDDEFGDVVVRGSSTQLDFIGENFFFMVSSALEGNFSSANNIIPQAFAIIQIGGSHNDVMFNTFVGGRKEFYNNQLIPSLDKLDVAFYYNDGSLVDFVGTHHSFVLRVTQKIQKVGEIIDYNSRIGK